jgi:aldehyde:ferredoxin oxidoreductase
MGAKGLKAVVARGAPAEPPNEELARLREEYAEQYADADTGRWQAAGETLESIDFADEVGALATEGWRKGTFEGADAVGIDAARKASVGRENPDDPVPGGFRVETDDGETVPRGATQMTLGAGLGVDDFDAVAALGGCCDRLGIDVISAGNAVAWLARASEDGAIDASVEFGDPDTARAVIRCLAGASAMPSETGSPHDSAMASETDDSATASETDPAVAPDVDLDPAVIETLRLGVDAATERFGVDGIPTVKSMELPAYDPRAAVGMALAYATSDRGGCHRRARPIEREVFGAWSDADRIEAVIAAQNARSLSWSLVADDFAGETLRDGDGVAFLRALSNATDLAYPTTVAELAATGERIWTLVRLFNAREGADRADDALPDVLSEPIADGPAAGSRIDPDEFAALLDGYYHARGWGREGLPTRETLDRLGLADVRDPDTPVGTPFASASE